MIERRNLVNQSVSHPLKACFNESNTVIQIQVQSIQYSHLLIGIEQLENTSQKTPIETDSKKSENRKSSSHLHQIQCYN